MNNSDTVSRSQRLREELYKYALISAYLFVCFSVILLYQMSTQTVAGDQSLPFGLALVKALVLGKFILIGEALSIGSRADSHPLLHRIAWKSIAMLLLLVVFKILEEIIVGWFHHQTLAQVADEFFQRSWIQIVAPLLMMLLVLIPLTVGTELYRAIGADRIREVLTGRDRITPSKP